MTKLCCICKNEFYPMTRTHKVCSEDCAIKFAEEKKAKEERKQYRAVKKEFNQKDRSYQLKKTQDIFNRWIRNRDGNICITCGSTDRQIHAGHFMPQGRHSEVRFDAHNVHSQCSVCNNHKSGNLAVYRQKLIGKYGIEEVERLEHSTTKKWSIEELIQIQKEYKCLTK